MIIDKYMHKLIAKFQIKSHKDYLKLFKDPKKHQIASLKKILQRTKGSDVSKELGLENVHNYEEFKNSIDFTIYDTYAPFIDYASNVENRANIFTKKKVECFGVTSGTTSRQKKIPFQAFYREEYMRTVLAWYGCIRTHRPKAFSGKVSYNVNPCYNPGETATHIKSLGMAPYNFRRVPSFMKNELFVCKESIYFEKFSDDQLKVILLARSISLDLTLFGQILPELVFNFFNLIFEYSDLVLTYIKTGEPPFGFPEHVRSDLVIAPNPRAYDRVKSVISNGKISNIKELYPSLDTIVCWKTSTAGYYLTRLKKIIPDDIAIWDGIYSATEGWLNYTLDPNEIGGPVAIKSHFVEFREADNEDALIIPTWELEDKKQYEVFITNSAGMFRYRINDVVKVDGFYENTPRIQFVDKSGDVLSVNWEKVTADQVQNLLLKIVKLKDLDVLRIDYFCIAACRDTEKPYFCLMVETDYEIENFSGFDLNKMMCDENYMYEKSYKENLLAPLKLVIIPKGTYSKEIATNNGDILTQVKFSRVLKNDEIIKKYCY
jgi:hypothetical protein